GRRPPVLAGVVLDLVRVDHGPVSRAAVVSGPFRPGRAGEERAGVDDLVRLHDLDGVHDLVVLAGRPVRGGRRLLWSVLRERQGVVRPGVRAGAGRNALGGDLGRAPALGGPGQPREHGRRLRVLAGVPDGARGGLLFAQAALVRLVGGQGGELSAVAG